MRVNRLILGILITVLWVGWSSCSSAGQDGLLIINVDLARLNNRGDETGVVDPITGYRLKNLNTQHVYHFFIVRSRVYVDAEEVEEGIYCLDSASLANLELPYCDEPFFRVIPGKVNNAGWWRIGYSLDTGAIKLIFGAKNFEAVLTEAKQYEKDLLRKYGLEVDHPQQPQR